MESQQRQRSITGTKMNKFVVKEEAGLIDYLISLGFNRTRVKQFIKFRAVAVNNETIVTHDHHLHPGDSISLSFEKKPVSDTAPKFGIQILYEDDAVLVIDKPAGLLTIGTEKERTKTAYFQLNEFLRSRKPEKRERIFIVHRLDRETSGLIVFAKTETAKRLLQENWSGVEKLYLAVVEGVPREKKGTISGYLGETSTLRVYEARGPEKASYSVTKYRVLKSSREHSLLEIELGTGRKHQIRVHFSGLGHPVAGDKRYGAGTDPLKRLALHAHKLSFPHPVTKRLMAFESQTPQAFDLIISRMKSS
jgi:23S rRNA pseudouridine1911/1915/1917 synthase